MLALKKLLTKEGWDFPKQSLRVNETTMMLEYLGKEVLKVDGNDAKLNIEWRCEDWKVWTEFQNHAEFTELQKKWDGVLRQAGDKQGKGGKGAPKGSSKSQ